MRSNNIMRSSNIVELVGNTPIVRLHRLENDCPGVRLYLKLEYQNPCGSVKDRPALQMMRDAESNGALTREKIIIDATSGNTGIAYSMIGAALGYRVRLVMPESVSEARKSITRAHGAELVFTSAEEGIDGSILHVQAMAEAEPDLYFYPNQYGNPSNPRSHYLGTGLEILSQLGDDLTDFVTGIGTTGTVMGITHRLREHHRRINCYGAEPATSEHGLAGLKHMASSIVPAIYSPSELDGVLPIGTEEGLEMCCRLAEEEGLYVGSSTGGNVVAALQIAKRRSAAQLGGPWSRSPVIE